MNLDAKTRQHNFAFTQLVSKSHCAYSENVTASASATMTQRKMDLMCILLSYRKTV
jgi:hypothetical protein